MRRSASMDAAEVIKRFQLEPLPGEGGYFRQSYTSLDKISASSLPRHKEERLVATCIYYLLTAKEFSALHLMKSDEIWHFYLGDPAEMIQIDKAGKLDRFILGQDFKTNQHLQLLAPHGVWQGTRLVEGGNWALVGCNVSPGFEFADSEVGTFSELVELYPQHKQLIKNYTHS